MNEATVEAIRDVPRVVTSLDVTSLIAGKANVIRGVLQRDDWMTVDLNAVEDAVARRIIEIIVEEYAIESRS